MNGTSGLILDLSFSVQIRYLLCINKTQSLVKSLKLCVYVHVCIISGNYDIDCLFRFLSIIFFSGRQHIFKLCMTYLWLQILEEKSFILISL